ncbi:MAG: sulfite exporter TauE/SafE family protein [Candidatus Kapaibacterium sp.]
MTTSLLATLAAGFALGLAGSLHCAGMCGPIAISLPGGVRRGRIVGDAWHAPRGIIAHRMLYQLGRVLTYSTLGAIVGLGGSAIRVAGFSRGLSISAGVLMLVMGAGQLVIRRGLKPTTTNANTIYQRFTSQVQRWIQSSMAKHGAFTHLGIGLANGLLPCGLVTTALIASLAIHSVSGSILFMASFGFGTLPLMSAIAIFGLAIPCGWRTRLRLTAPIVGLALALLIIVRGLGLGIPYVSPAAQTASGPITCCGR